MTLFETLPQFTMFVLFFMLGFVTRFFAQITMLLCGTIFELIGKRVVSICRKIILAVKESVEKRINIVKMKHKLSKTNQTEMAESEPNRKKSNITKAKQVKNINVEQNSTRFEKMSRAKAKQGKASSFWELFYFISIGILTLKVFAMFEFVEFFWFIPLSVILGVVIHDYLTKEIFAKRKKI